jgi:hypothetical protein
LNEVVSKIADVTLEQANDLIAIGAVWAKMDVLTEDEILDHYSSSSKGNNDKVRYSDLPSGWGNARYEREEIDLENLDEFIHTEMDPYRNSSHLNTSHRASSHREDRL